MERKKKLSKFLPAKNTLNEAETRIHPKAFRVSHWVLLRRRVIHASRHHGNSPTDVPFAELYAKLWMAWPYFSLSQ